MLIIALAAAPVMRVATGFWPDGAFWVWAVGQSAFALQGILLGHSWRRPVSRRKRRQYDEWRRATELDADELAGPSDPVMIPRRFRQSQPQRATSASPLMELLENAETPDEVEAILGKRALNTYALVIHGATLLLSAAVGHYIVVVISGGREWPLALGFLPALIFLVLVTGSMSYSDLHSRVSHRRAPTPFFIRFLTALNRDI